MLLNPCTAPLVPGSYGQVGFKVRRFVTEFTVSVAPNEYCTVLWMPEYSCASTIPSEAIPVNSVWMRGAGSDTITNTLAHPFANTYGAAGIPYQATTQDPVYDFSNSSSVRDTRLVAACIDATYQGRSDAHTSTIAKIPSLPLSALFRNVSGAMVYTGASLSQFFAHAVEPTRTADTTSIRTGPQFNTTDFVNLGHSPLLTGETGVTTSTVEEELLRQDDPAFFGFAIKAGTEAQTYSFRYTKVVEYREEDLVYGLTTAPTAQTAAPVSNPLRAATAHLDKAAPAWRTNDSLASKLEDLAGVANFVKDGMGVVSGIYNAATRTQLPIALKGF